MKSKYTFEDFLNIMDRLRAPDGCPWDKVQTHESLKGCMLEEAYEAVDAIENKDMANLCEELGDVLLQVVFHAKIAGETNAFDMQDVIDGISRKMILRHPHIFSDAVAETPEAVLDNWEEIKKKEKQYKSQTEILKSVPASMPALMRAEKVQAKAAKVGFDFNNLEEAMEKVYEEANELKCAILENNGRVEEEYGDILFSFVNLSRFLQINPEFSLTKATKKFINRFEYVEDSALLQKKKFSELSLDEMNQLWEESKQHEY